MPGTSNTRSATVFILSISPPLSCDGGILEKVGWLYPAWCHDHDLWLRIARAGGTFEKIPVRLGMDRMRPETLGRLAELVIPAKIGLTKRFFAEPRLPPNLQRLRRRAISSAYVHGVDYLQVNQPRHWLMAVRLLAQATLADPLNISAIKERATRPFRYHVPRLRSQISEPGTLVALPRRWLGRVVQRIFVRGNRDLTFKVDSLQQVVAAGEQATSVALDAVASRLHRIAAEVLRLTDDLESSRREQKVQIAAVEARMPQILEQIAARLEDRIAKDRSVITDAVDSLRLQQEALRKQLEAAQERPPKLSDSLSEIYGTPPALRPIPRWHTYWGVENGSDGLLRDRVELWSVTEEACAHAMVGRSSRNYLAWQRVIACSIPHWKFRAERTDMDEPDTHRGNDSDRHRCSHGHVHIACIQARR